MTSIQCKTALLWAESSQSVSVFVQFVHELAHAYHIQEGA
jgi:hypothetical protein